MQEQRTGPEQRTSGFAYDDPSIRRAYADLAKSSDELEKVTMAAQLILAIFDHFYAELCEYPYRAQRAFEAIDPQSSIRLSKERLDLYSQYILEHAPRFKRAFPRLARRRELWDEVDAVYLPLIVDRYEADIAFSFSLSMQRNVFRTVWQPVEYSFSAPSEKRTMSLAAAHRRMFVTGVVGPALIETILGIPDFAAPFHDASMDARRVADRANRLFESGAYGDLEPVALDVLDAGFFRDLTAFIVGRWVGADGRHAPFVLALLNSVDGIYVDAVLHETADCHNLFSSALANFHVTNELYYQTCVFLYSIMPKRPLGLHYSTIGFNHVGKVAVLNELKEQLSRSGELFDITPGFAGTVAIGFTFASSTYHLKVIRDSPTRAYKWGNFLGVDAVLDKYRIVHEINRTGSMLDNIMYFNLKLQRDMFHPDLLTHLREEASESVFVDGDTVLIRSLIVQLKLIPLPAYLESANEDEMKKVITNLGDCIKNNQAANIFNKDLDSRNYGVGRYGKVLLFDYDAVEKFTDVKIRTNTGREDGEEDVPDWFFEDGIVFLPEELENGLQIRNRAARLYFRQANADLLDVGYWQNLQDKLKRGEVVGLSLYPERCKLDVAVDAGGQRTHVDPQTVA